MKTKDELVNEIIGNAGNSFAEKDRPTLNSMPDEVLKSILPTENKTADEIAKEEEEKAAAEKKAKEDANKIPATNTAQTTQAAPGTEQAAGANTIPATNARRKTADEYIAELPKDVAAVLTNGLNLHNKAKANLIAAITANANNKFTAEQLKAKDLGELQAIASLAVNKQEIRLEDFSGQGEFADMLINNKKVEPLVAPKW